MEFIKKLKNAFLKLQYNKNNFTDLIKIDSDELVL